MYLRLRSGSFIGNSLVWYDMCRNPACQDMCSKCYREVCSTHERTAAQSKAAAAAFSETLPVPEASPLPIPSVLSTPDIEAAVRPEPATSQPADSAVDVASPASDSESFPSPADSRPPQKNPGRCFVCNKRVGLTGFKCRCDYVFCGAHRLAEAHDCSFDYKKVERQRLARNNPLISASKVDKL